MFSIAYCQNANSIVIKLLKLIFFNIDSTAIIAKLKKRQDCRAYFYMGYFNSFFKLKTLFCALTITND